MRTVGRERHFEVVGKWGIAKWFRIPDALYQGLLAIRTASPYVFAAYPDQLRAFHARSQRKRQAKLVAKEFKPVNLGNGFHEQIVAWSVSQPKGRATRHVFRKTSLQYARSGEDVNREVAADARLSEGVMMTNSVKETDEQMRAKSNRMYRRILASLGSKVAQRYCYTPEVGNDLEQELDKARATKDWKRMAEIIAEMERQQRGMTG